MGSTSLLISRMCSSAVPWIKAPGQHFWFRKCSLSMTISQIHLKCTQVPLLGHARNYILRPTYKLAFSARPTTFRLFSSSCKRTAKRQQRSWDVDGIVSKDTVVYSYRNDKYYRMITIFGITQLVFWGNMALFSYSGLSRLDDPAVKKRMEGDSFWNQVLEYQVKYKYRIAVLCVAIGYAVMFFTWMYPQRSIQKLTLLTGGHNLRVTTYTHLGKTREFEVPLSNISSNQTRTIDQPTMSFKIKGHWFYYIIDKKNGAFHEPVLFDSVVNLKRNVK